MTADPTDATRYGGGHRCGVHGGTPRSRRAKVR